VELLSIWLHVEACALYPLNSADFLYANSKYKMNLNIFEAIVTSFGILVLHHYGKPSNCIRFK
jgi:hypothetical protein